MQRGSTIGGLLIFHHRDSGTFTNSLRLEVIEADNSDAVGTSIAAASMAHFYPGTSSNTEFSENSTPSSDDVSGNPSGLALLEIENNDGVVSAIVDFGTPDAPDNFSVTNRTEDGENPVLDWDDNSESDINHYAVYRGYQDSPQDPVNWNSSPSATPTASTWTDNTVTIDHDATTRVWYRATAVDDADNESGYSAADNVNSFDTPKIYPGDERNPAKTEAAAPTVLRLYQNHPNPFNPETQIRFDLPESAHVRLVIYNLLGEQVRVLTDSRYQAGFHRLTWDSRNASGIAVPSGVYVYRLVTDQRNNVGVVGKMTLLR